MVQSLAGSLASVSSREPLRVSMISHLRNLLLQNGHSEQTVSEQAVFMIVSDNIELACSVMEKSAAEKAVVEGMFECDGIVDEALANAYATRQKHRERPGIQPFYDINVYAASRYPSTLHESLRLKPGGLSPAQFHVYEEFTRVPRHPPPPAPYSADSRTGRSENGQYGDEQAIPAPQALERFGKLLLDLDALIHQNLHLPSLASIPSNHEIPQVLRQISSTLTTCANRDEVALLSAQKVTGLMYASESVLSREGK